MRSLLGFELYKLFKQKMIYLTFIGLLIITSSYMLNFERPSDAEKELYSKWEGTLTQEKVERSQVENEKLNVLIDKRVEEMEEKGEVGAAFSEEEATKVGMYETIAFIQGADDRTALRLSELEGEESLSTALETSILKENDFSYFAYNKAPREIIDYTSTFSLVVTGLMLMIGLSGMYSREYSSGVENYMLSSKRGRKDLARAKIIAALIYTFIIVVIGEAWNIISKIYLFGNEGWSTTIQYIFKYHFSPFGFSMIEYHLIQLGIHLLAAFSFALLILFISSLCRNVLVSLIVSGAIFGVPYFIVELVQMPTWLREALQFSYLYIMKVDFLFTNFNAINVFGQPILYPFVAILWMLILSVLFAYTTVRVMRTKQVA
ncbi:hypothetical protein [Guptibacillus algicola]|uniref:hypothetical protein n=1 Tax=Guptibacillus algicola TaxID=225844 RepID=UPI001CD425D3|nr:hypothetical protein [Alkalihalobacillus algicola]MCA0987517.1 hypothetical protein [Alkalihalobacillus algicola]